MRLSIAAPCWGKSSETDGCAPRQPSEFPTSCRANIRGLSVVADVEGTIRAIVGREF